MKTAISIPDALFESADALAKRLGLLRSDLYAVAVAEFLAKHDPSQVQERLDRLYSIESMPPRAPVRPGPSEHATLLRLVMAPGKIVEPQFAREVQIAACVRWYAQGLVSQERAAEIAGLSRADSWRSFFGEAFRPARRLGGADRGSRV
jgi:hypothetical protein